MEHFALTAIMLALLGQKHAPGKAGVRMALAQTGTLLTHYASRTLSAAGHDGLRDWLEGWAPDATAHAAAPVAYLRQLVSRDERMKRNAQRQWSRAYGLAERMAALADAHHDHPDHRVARQAALLGHSAVHTALHGQLGLDLLDGDNASLSVSQQRQRDRALDCPATLESYLRDERRRPVAAMDRMAQQAAHLTTLLRGAYGSRPADTKPLVQRLVAVAVDEEVPRTSDTTTRDRRRSPDTDKVCEVQYYWEGPAAVLRFALAGGHSALAAKARAELADALAARRDWHKRLKTPLTGPLPPEACAPAPAPVPLTEHFRPLPIRIMPGYGPAIVSGPGVLAPLTPTWEFVGSNTRRRTLVCTNSTQRAAEVAPSGVQAPGPVASGHTHWPEHLPRWSPKAYTPDAQHPESYTTSRRWLEQYPELYAFAPSHEQGAIPMVDHGTQVTGVPYFQGTRGSKSWVSDGRTEDKRRALVAWMAEDTAEDLLDCTDTVEELVEELLAEVDSEDLREALLGVMSYTPAQVPDADGNNWSESAVHTECQDLLDGLDRACGDFALCNGDTYSFGGFDYTGDSLRRALTEALYGLAKLYARLHRYGEEGLVVARPEAVDGTGAVSIPMSPKARILKAGWEPLPKVNRRKARLRKCRIRKCWEAPEYRSPTDKHMYCEACASERV